MHKFYSAVMKKLKFMSLYSSFKKGQLFWQHKLRTNSVLCGQNRRERGASMKAQRNCQVPVKKYFMQSDANIMI